MEGRKKAGGGQEGREQKEEREAKKRSKVKHISPSAGQMDRKNVGMI